MARLKKTVQLGEVLPEEFLKLPTASEAGKYQHIVLSKEDKIRVKNELRIQFREVGILRNPTPEHYEIAFEKERQRKYYIQKDRQYWELVNMDKPFHRYSASHYGQIIASKAQNDIPGFKIDDFNREVMWKLCLYFTSDSRMEKYGMSPNKGILLWGPVGCGKTLTMKLFLKNPLCSYVIKGCNQIGYDFAQNGFESLKYYSERRETVRNEFGQREYGFCFDDFGTEEERKYYGEKVDAMAEIIANRYMDNLWNSTHLTTNLIPSTILEIYGHRLYSRMAEMFNVIEFPKNAIDRRLAK